jgi:predicted acylesterase/phospholipase RssA
MALNEHYDLQNSTVTMVGASAGALAATLAATGADLERGLDLALDLSERAGVFERGGLGLVWGGLVREWLQELLPDDAHLLCRDRVHLLALRIFPLRRERIHGDNLQL